MSVVGTLVKCFLRFCDSPEFTGVSGSAEVSAQAIQHSRRAFKRPSSFVTAFLRSCHILAIIHSQLFQFASVDWAIR
jgi:hypothetical protein